MRRPLPILLLLLPLAACTGMTDPMERPGTWQPTGANDRNLRLMVADPAHLERGIGVTTERGEAATMAAERLSRDDRRPLPVVNTSRAVPGGAR